MRPKNPSAHSTGVVEPKPFAYCLLDPLGPNLAQGGAVILGRWNSPW